MKSLFKTALLTVGLSTAAIATSEAQTLPPKDTLVRFVILVQESLLQTLGTDKVKQYAEANHVFVEKSVANANQYFGLNLPIKTTDTATKATTLNIVAVLSVPNNQLPDTATNPGTMLTRLKTAGDGKLDNFHPDTLAKSYNQAKVVLVVEPTIASSNGFADNKATVLRNNAFQAPHTYGLSHEETHLFGTKHSDARTSPTDIMLNGKVVLPATKPTLENAVGPYYPFLSKNGTGTIWSGKDGVVISSQEHPSLDILTDAPDTVKANQQFMLTSTLHASRANTNPNIIIKDAANKTLRQGKQTTSTMQIPLTAPSTPGIYKITTTVSNAATGETAKNTIDVLVQTTVDTKESAADLPLEVIPNPTNGVVTINFAHPEQIKELMVTSLDGKWMKEDGYTIDVAHQSINLDISNLPANTYLLSIKDTHGNWHITKVIKQ